LNNWPCIQSSITATAYVNKNTNSFSGQSDKKFYKEWSKAQKKILKSIPSNAVLLSIKEMV